MLQIISDVREPLDSFLNNRQDLAQQFGEPDDMPQKGQINNVEDLAPTICNLGSLRAKYMAKYDEHLAELQEFNEQADNRRGDLAKVIQRARHCHAVLEEINLREKLTIRRALSLCLILLK